MEYDEQVELARKNGYYGPRVSEFLTLIGLKRADRPKKQVKVQLQLFKKEGKLL